MKFLLTSTQKMQLTIIFLTYLIFASIFGFAYRYAMNPDGISLLRLAGYVAEGNFQQSVTRAWSPLMTWLISPFLFFGFDGLTAAWIVIALCGAVLLLCSWFLALRVDLSQNLRFIATLIAALLISFWTIQFIASDVLVAALLLCYIYNNRSGYFNKQKKFFFLWHHWWIFIFGTPLCFSVLFCRWII